MKHNKKIIGVIGIVCIVAVIGIAVLLSKGDAGSENNNSINSTEDINTNNSNDDVNENNNDTENNSSVNTDDIDVTEIKFTDEKILNAKEYMSSYDVITIRKTISTNVITTEPEYSSEFSTLKDVCTEIDLSTMTDRTVLTDDYINVDATELNFEDEFGFNYKGYDNTFDISLAVAQAHGININLENSVLDENLKEVYGQYVYTLKDNSTVINTILADLDYDEILESSCTYRMSDFISYFDARIKYTKDGQTVFYNLCLQIGLPESDAGCGCGCGSTDESTCGNDDCTTCNPVETNYE